MYIDISRAVFPTGMPYINQEKKVNSAWFRLDVLTGPNVDWMFFLVTLW